MSQILTLKMVGGDEVVAEVIDIVRDGNPLLSGNGTKDNTGPIISYMVRRPHILRFMPVGPGQSGLVFIPWTLSNPTIERMHIPASQVFLTYEPSGNVEKQYIEQTSGIEIAKPNSRISV